MKIKELKEKMVLFNPKAKLFYQIKEITRLRNGKPYTFVMSGGCEYFEDSMTTVTREVFNSKDMGYFFYLDPICESTKEGGLE